MTAVGYTARISGAFVVEWSPYQSLVAVKPQLDQFLHAIKSFWHN
jgi:hypothetical protein